MQDLSQSTSRAAAPSETVNRVTNIFEDGVLTGIVGAAVVAVWFLVLDTARGQMLFTPSLLGSVIFLGQSPEDVVSINPYVVFAYTGLHGVLFLIAGAVLARMFATFERNPQFGIVILLLFLLFESILFSAAAAIFPNLIGALGAVAVACGNLFAAIAMFGFLIRRHPGAITQLRLAWHAQ
ncbi:MAG TPA: hypothetical protein VMT22_07630 [Terriglobales bacterium]|jgi:hypothetical protein|nr:hypothetical protein [Terriglobales bacterium]